MLVPNKRQQTRLFQFAGTARFAYNWALRKEIDAYEAGEKFISTNDLRKEFTENNFKQCHKTGNKRFGQSLRQIFQRRKQASEI